MGVLDFIKDVTGQKKLKKELSEIIMDSTNQVTFKELDEATGNVITKLADVPDESKQKNK